MVFDLLALTSLPVTVAAVEAIRHGRQLEKQDDEEEQYRMREFHLNVFCDAKSRKRDQVDGKIVVLHDDKLYLTSMDPKTNKPKPLDNSSESPHPFTGFYLSFQPEKVPTPNDMFERLNKPKPFRGLVSTISEQPPTLNWIYVDKYTLEVKYGSRVEANGHILGPWDWTEDEKGLTLEDWEGFVAVEQERGLWAIYYDRDDDNLKGKVSGRRVLQCSLERKVFEGGEDVEHIVRR